MAHQPIRRDEPARIKDKALGYELACAPDGRGDARERGGLIFFLLIALEGGEFPLSERAREEADARLCCGRRCREEDEGERSVGEKRPDHEGLMNSVSRRASPNLRTNQRTVQAAPPYGVVSTKNLAQELANAA